MRSRGGALIKAMRDQVTTVWHRMLTVRGRSALLSAGVVAVAMTIGAIVLLGSFRTRLEDNLDQTLEQQVLDRVAVIEQGTDPALLADTLQDETLVWIGAPDGTPIAVGGARRPLENPIPDVVGTTTDRRLLVEERKSDHEVEIERSEFRIASATTGDGMIVVLAGAETEGLDKTLRPLRKLFVTAVPILVLLVGVLGWIVAGRALRPVEHIRRRTKTVSGSSLSDRVPVPKGDDEIHDLAITMNEMLERLESHERSLRQFTADASHELKSPVANIRVLVETTEIADPAWAPLQQTLANETDRLRDLVDNLLFLARHADGASETVPKVVHLDDLIFDEAELLARTKNVAVDIGNVEPASIRGNASALQRLVRNLADNAARHATSTVTFASAQHLDGSVTLTIEDDGEGIPAADRERVFERFTRLDDARNRDAGGAGLGLAIVRQIAHDHDGTATVGHRTTSNAPGTAVTVNLRQPS